MSAEEILRRAKARVGKVIDDKWTLDELLGVGGMAAVYAATHRNSKRAALKILHASEAADPNIKARFMREGYVANQVGHPGAVSVLDDDETTDGTVYLVMELLDGESLEQRAPAGTKMAAGDVLTLMDQLLAVLDAAHAKGIIHRDIKPGNLFLTKEHTLKVLDFGIARVHEMARADEKASAQQTPKTTLSALGTPGFMPPEQARGRWELVDARSDVWAVGATMFTLLTGKWLHDEGTLNEQLLAAMTKPVPKLMAVAPEVPAPVAELVDKALAFESDDRFQSVREMREVLRNVYAEITGRPLSVAPNVVSLPPAAPRPSLENLTPTIDASRSTSVGAEVSIKPPGRSTTMYVGVGAAMLAALASTSPTARRSAAASRARGARGVRRSSSCPRATSAHPR